MAKQQQGEKRPARSPRGANPGGPGGDAPNERGGGDAPRGQREGRGRRGGEPREPREEREELDERVIDITRVAKVIKGGRRFAFRTVVVVGDGQGRIGIGIGKARGVPDAIRKGSDRARRNLNKVALSGNTIPYSVVGEYGGAKVLIKPASPGTGVIAGGGVRAVVEVAGIRDILTKSQGSNNLLNVAMATLMALRQLRSTQELAMMRGKTQDSVKPFWERRPSSTVTIITPTEGENNG